VQCWTCLQTFFNKTVLQIFFEDENVLANLTWMCQRDQGSQKITENSRSNTRWIPCQRLGRHMIELFGDITVSTKGVKIMRRHPMDTGRFQRQRKRRGCWRIQQTTESNRILIYEYCATKQSITSYKKNTDYDLIIIPSLLMWWATLQRSWCLTRIAVT
jgi:hypothetical protein